jgi:hypothetical protein
VEEVLPIIKGMHLLKKYLEKRRKRGNCYELLENWM